MCLSFFRSVLIKSVLCPCAEKRRIYLSVFCVFMSALFSAVCAFPSSSFSRRYLCTQIAGVDLTEIRFASRAPMLDNATLAAAKTRAQVKMAGGKTKMNERSECGMGGGVRSNGNEFGELNEMVPVDTRSFFTNEAVGEICFFFPFRFSA